MIQTNPYWPNSIGRAVVTWASLHLIDIEEPKDDVSDIESSNHDSKNHVHTITLLSLSDWQQFVSNKLSAWEQMNLQWAKNFSGDVHIVYFDDLVENVGGTLRKILEFIRFPINEVVDYTVCHKSINTIYFFTGAIFLCTESQRRHLPEKKTDYDV